MSDGVYFPDGSYFALGFWDQSSLLSELRHSILKSLVARNCFQPETAKLLESWPLDRSGFSAFVGDPISQPADRPRLQRVLNYILRPALPLKHLPYVEATGQVKFSPPRPIPKIWEHAYDFFADWVQHIPRARQHQVDVSGGTDIYISNRLGCDMTVTLEFTEQVNVQGNPPFPCTRTVPGHREILMSRISRLNSHDAWRFRYMYYWNYGNHEARQDDSVVYSLPYKAGTTQKIIQGFHGAFSHTGDDEYTVDFGFASNTPVLAAREGVVEEGQKVRRGDLIGYSGSTGFSSGPHLHFCVYSADDGHHRHSYPIRFNVSGNPAPVELVQGSSYTAP